MMGTGAALERLFTCPECGGEVRMTTGPGRSYEYRTDRPPMILPDDLALPTCASCGEEYSCLVEHAAIEKALAAWEARQPKPVFDVKAQQNPLTGEESGACFSECGLYRYWLWRDFGTHLMPHKTCLFVMLNPSTADETTDDPTIRRCIGYARSWGYQRLEVANLFALRATDPERLKEVADPVGPDNDWVFGDCARRADLIVCAWGAYKAHPRRVRDVLWLLRRHADLSILGLTETGRPRHPLYARKTLQPMLWLGKEHDATRS